MKAAVRSDARTKLLASRVVAGADNWTGRIVGNVAWAHAVLQHGPPHIMDIVSPITVHDANADYTPNDCSDQTLHLRIASHPNFNHKGRS